MKLLKSLWFVAAMAVVLIAGCAPFGVDDNKVNVVFSAADGIARNIAPGPGGTGLVLDEYRLHGIGIDGAAVGSTFDLVIPAGASSGNINLLTGNWTVQAIGWNATARIGASAVVPFLVQVGMAQQNIPLVVIEDVGEGTFAVLASWLPDILLAPSITAEAVTFGGVSTPVVMTLDNSISAHGSVALQNGFYVGILQVYDNGVLAAGSVEALRIAAAQTSTWTAYYTVSQLEGGGIVFGPEFNPKNLLTLTTNLPEGTMEVYAGDPDLIFTVTGADFDGGQTGLYTWYRQGELIALSTSPSYTFPVASLEVGEWAFLSVAVWQTDGTRLGTANWGIVKSSVDPETLDLHGTMNTTTSSPNVIAIEAQAPLAFWTDHVAAVGTTLAYSWADLPAGVYEVRGFNDANGNHVWNVGETQVTRSLTVPHDSGLSYDLTAGW